MLLTQKPGSNIVNKASVNILCGFSVLLFSTQFLFSNYYFLAFDRIYSEKICLMLDLIFKGAYYKVLKISKKKAVFAKLCLKCKIKFLTFIISSPHQTQTQH